MLGSAGRWLVRALDKLMRRASDILEFSSDADCLLRLRVTTSKEQVDFIDGRAVHSGERIGELHLWSERVPIMSANGPDVRWAITMRRRFEHSLRLLAGHVERVPDLQLIEWFRGRGALSAPPDQPSPFRVLDRLGFRVLEPPAANDFRSRFVRFWKNLHNWWLVWTFNPSSLIDKRFGDFARVEFWISRDELMERYGTPVGSASAQPPT